MRGAKGKLICIWSPVLHGEGCSTVACSIGFGLQYYSGKRVLIVNKSNSTSNMEKYMEADIEIKYSMDNLKIFNTGIRAEHITTYATQVNKGLYVIGGSKFNREITRENIDFDRLFLEGCLEYFDIVIADIDTGVREENKHFLENADIVAAVFTPNEIVLDELHQNSGMKSAFEYFASEKAVHILNKLYEGWDANRIIGSYRGKYSMNEVFGLNYDGEILSSCCTNRNFYSFLVKELKREKNGYIKQLADICGFLSQELCMGKGIRDSMQDRKFRSFLRSSLF